MASVTSMASIDQVVDSLRQRVSDCEARLRSLKHQLAEAVAQARSSNPPGASSDPPSLSLGNNSPESLQEEPCPVPIQLQLARQRWPLNKDEYKRYGRQLIMPEVGLQGQLLLKAASVLIVGVGGLGCPAAAYLAGAGVGTIGLVDGDTVEESNLHRQILHNTETVGMSKVDSAIVYLKSLNPTIKYVPYRSRLSPDTALDIFRTYDLVLDCTDTPASRYLISDTCVLLGKPLVSASALRTEGQLMVLNHPARPPGDSQGGPCYRCVFPKPPPPESVVSCGEGGILGPVVGVMGVLQALEAIKIVVAGLPPSLPSGSVHGEGGYGISHGLSNGSTMQVNVEDRPSLLLFSAYSNPPFRTIRLRSRKSKCATCSAHATVTPEALASGSLDYAQFCGAISPIDALEPAERISARGYADVRAEREVVGTDECGGRDHALIDVREKVQFDLGSIEGSINIPYSEIAATRIEDGNVCGDTDDPWVDMLRQIPSLQPIYVVCRLGNDSQLAVRKFKELGLGLDGSRWIGDVAGGLDAWRQHVDPDFPEY